MNDDDDGLQGIFNPSLYPVYVVDGRFSGPSGRSPASPGARRTVRLGPRGVRSMGMGAQCSSHALSSRFPRTGGQTVGLLSRHAALTPYG